jgi:serine protease Do
MNGMKVVAVLLGVYSLLSGGLWAQFNPVRQKDRKALQEQAEGFFAALRPAVAEAAKGVVEVRVWSKRVAYGTVIGRNRILTKWSEVQRDVFSLSCRTSDGRWLAATVTGIYREADLAILEVEGLNAAPVIFTKESSLDLGSFLILARPDGEAGSLGVVSVQPRSLRVDDQGFLGISMSLEYEGVGVKVEAVEKKTGAARAGLIPGDVILEVNGREANGSFELRSSLQRVSPGEDVRLKVRRGKAEMEKVTQLGSRPKGRGISEDRMAHMNALGGHRYNEVRGNFPNVIQSDMQIQPEDCGAPVVGLDGAVIGMTVARAGRIKSYIIPTSSIIEMLASAPGKPTKFELARGESRDTKLLRRHLRSRGKSDSPEAIRRHLEELRRFEEAMESTEP